MSNNSNGIIRILLLFLSTTLSVLCIPQQSLCQTTSPVFVSGTLKHYYEFDSQENPNNYYWCGHTALKSVGKYVTGNIKTLQEIHNTFYKNSSKGYGSDSYCYNGSHWCAKLQDLYWAAQYTKNGGYGRYSSVIRTVSKGSANSPNYSAFFSKIKEGVYYNYPPIIPSSYYYSNAGHFWIITGYLDTGNPRTSVLYLRDVAISSPIYEQYDRTETIETFFNQTQHSNNSIQILFVK